MHTEELQKLCTDQEGGKGRCGERFRRRFRSINSAMSNKVRQKDLILWIIQSGLISRRINKRKRQKILSYEEADGHTDEIGPFPNHLILRDICSINSDICSPGISLWRYSLLLQVKGQGTTNRLFIAGVLNGFASSSASGLGSKGQGSVSSADSNLSQSYSILQSNRYFVQGVGRRFKRENGCAQVDTDDPAPSQYYISYLLLGVRPSSTFETKRLLLVVKSYGTKCRTAIY